MTSVEEKRWYAIQVKSRCERRVSAHLHAMGIEGFLPVYTARRQWSDRSKIIKLPLFPCYVFGRVTRVEQVPVRQAPGVRSLVGFEAGPVPVDDFEIDSIRRMVDSGLALKPRERFAEGQGVRVEQGPLAGCEGVLERFKGAQRLIVNISLLRRSVAVEIDPSWVSVMPQAGAEAKRTIGLSWSPPRLRRGPI